MALAEDSQRQAATARDRYERVTREIELKKKKQEQLEKAEKSLLDDLDGLAFLLNSKSKELGSLEGELSQTGKAILLQEDEMARLRDQMGSTQEQIENRMAALYKISKAGPWAFLLSTENYGDFLRMLRFLNSMINHDVHLLMTFKNQLEQKEAIQEKLTAYRSRLQGKRRAVRLKKEEIRSLKGQKERAVEKVSAAKRDSARLIKELEEQAEKLQALIKALPRARETPSGPLSGFRALKGKLPVPVEGKITRKVHGKLRGISLKAPVGAIVRTVYRGRVVYAGWFRGYGNLLIVDHGDSFHTVVGHASELLKKVDDWVETGDPIARVGNTGSLGGPSLYFEIRQNGHALDALEWFSREDRLALR